MRALSIRQPWAELILRGNKTIECRSRPTRVRGRIWIYAANSPARGAPLCSIADAAALQRGVLVGTAELVACRPLLRSDDIAACLAIDFDGYAWIIANPERLAVPRKPARHPQPVFFYPFGAA